jgi:two-component system, chemotaxis family, protein-glutamate methylesterase/glutaminase
MAKRDIVVIGASAGGVEALMTVIGGLPAALPAAVLVVLHVPANARSALPDILGRVGALQVVEARTNAQLAPGRLIIAPPDRHLTIRGEVAHLSRGPRINRHRPAVDPLFQTAAREAGPRVIGVVLSGVLDDGTSGMLAIRRAGGATIVQDPADALYGGMPRSVLEQMTVDRVLPASAIAGALVALAGQTVPDRTREPEPLMTSPHDDLETELLPPGEPDRPASGFTCPECHGALWTAKTDDLERFRCRVGHAFTPKGLFAAQAESIEEAMWAAYRALEESASLSARLAARARDQGLPKVAERHDGKYAEARQRAALIRQVLEKGSLDADLDDAATPEFPQARGA